MTNKEIQLYHAVVELLGEGHELFRLTVSQIAQKAGIGKGTVYEYFSSKDELLGGAMRYMAEVGYAEIMSVLKSERSFFDCFQTVLIALQQQQQYFQQMLVGDGMTKMPNFVQCRDDFKEKITNISYALLKKAQSEGITLSADDNYNHTAVLCAIAGFSFCSFAEDASFEELRENTYLVLENALRGGKK